MIRIRASDKPVRIIDELWRMGMPVEGVCGGIGICGKCRVKVIAGSENLNPRTRREEGLDPGERLACMAWVMRGEVIVEPINHGSGKFVAVGYEPTIPIKPLVKMKRVELNPPTLRSQVPDDVNLFRESGYRPRHLWIYRRLPSVLRECNWSVNIVYAWDEVINVKCSDSVFGAAIDIGSTKIVVHVVDLRNGNTIAYDVVENPQTRYGIDIISRASLAISDEGINDKLRELVIDAINSLIKKISSSSGIDPIDIDAVVVAGNTVMTQLFLGIRLNSLVQSPYIPTIGLSTILRASDVGLIVNPAAIVFIMPAVAGFIGGDAVADALVANLEEDRRKLLIDIGTNTEVMLRTSDYILAASAPAGSAIEGVGISSGVRAVEGAIDRVELVNGKLQAFTIGGGDPIGITGTGLIDLVAALMRAGSISRSGRLIPGPFVKERNGSLVIDINGITVTQRDIRLLQEAKAAIQSTWKTLLRAAGITERELDAVYVAGSFGTHINPDSAISIGLLPQAKVFFLGNAAISGAKLILRNADYWDKTTHVVNMIKVIEMAALDDYEKIFLESTMLGH